jgi:hypothetical protein
MLATQKVLIFVGTGTEIDQAFQESTNRSFGRCSVYLASEAPAGEERRRFAVD